MTPQSDAEQAEISFRLFGHYYRLSMEQFAVCLGLYTEDEVRQPLYTEAVYHTAKDVLQQWWTVIGDGRHADASTKATAIRDPMYRYLHRLIAGTILGRRQGTDHCNLRDVFYLRCLLTGRHCNLARCFAEYVAGYVTRQGRGSLMGGSYVTRIAHYFGHQTDIAELQLPPVHPKRVDIVSARGMGLVRRFKRRGLPDLQFLVRRGEVVRYVPVPLVEPEPIPGQEVDIQAEPFPEPDPQPDPQPDAHPDAEHHPQHVPVIYQAVRLPDSVDRRLQAIEEGIETLRGLTDWLVRDRISELRSSGRSFTYPPGYGDQPGTSGTRRRRTDDADEGRAG